MRGLDPCLKRHYFPFLWVTSDFLSALHLLKISFLFARFFSVWWSGIDPLYLAEPGKKIQFSFFLDVSGYCFSYCCSSEQVSFLSFSPSDFCFRTRKKKRAEEITKGRLTFFTLAFGRRIYWSAVLDRMVSTAIQAWPQIWVKTRIWLRQRGFT